jgi:hypothetical protein
MGTTLALEEHQRETLDGRDRISGLVLDRSVEPQQRNQ